MPEIIVDVYPNGEIKVETKGYSGSNCIQAAEFLKGLGVTTEFDLTPDYYRTTEEVERLYVR